MSQCANCNKCYSDEYDSCPHCAKRRKKGVRLAAILLLLGSALYGLGGLLERGIGCSGGNPRVGIKERLACENAVRLARDAKLPASFEGCLSGISAFRSLYGDAAYNRHVDCVLNSTEFQDAVKCDSIR
jgi:hypothetical protein